MIKVNNLQKHYDNFSLNCSLEVHAGNVTGFLGRNGSGKSTTFKAILGLIHPDQGDIQIFGQDINQLTAKDKQQLGIVFADSNYSRVFDCRDILKILKASYTQFDEKVFRDYIDRNHIPWDKKLEDFSTGMLAKIKIISAISHQAKLLILDEPTAGLDVVARNELIDLLRDYMVENPDNAILMSSHISTDLEGLCDNFYLIHQGEILLFEEMDRLLGQYGILKVKEEAMSDIDPQYIITKIEESYGYRCLTNERQYYIDNYPQLIIEKANIDEIIISLAGDR